VKNRLKILNCLWKNKKNVRSPQGRFFLTHTVHTEITIHSSLLSVTIQRTRQTVRLDNYNTVHQSPATYKLFQSRVLKPTNKLQNIYQQNILHNHSTNSMAIQYNHWINVLSPTKSTNNKQMLLFLLWWQTFWANFRMAFVSWLNSDGLELTTDWVSRPVCRFWCTLKTILFAQISASSAREMYTWHCGI